MIYLFEPVCPVDLIPFCLLCEPFTKISCLLMSRASYRPVRPRDRIESCVCSPVCLSGSDLDGADDQGPPFPHRFKTFCVMSIGKRVQKATLGYIAGSNSLEAEWKKGLREPLLFFMSSQCWLSMREEQSSRGGLSYLQSFPSV